MIKKKKVRRKTIEVERIIDTKYLKVYVYHKQVQVRFRGVWMPLHDYHFTVRTETKFTNNLDN
jgi:hypothetical protein